MNDNDIKKPYVAPQCDIIHIDIHQPLLSGSGSGSGSDYGDGGIFGKP